MNLSETRPGGVPDSYLLDGTATSSVGACAAGTCLIIDGAMYVGQLFNSVTGATVDGVVTAMAPFLVHVRTNGVQQANSLFDLTYRQIPC